MTIDSPAVPGSFLRAVSTAPAPPRQLVVCKSNGQFHTHINPDEIDQLIALLVKRRDGVIQSQAEART